MLYTLLWSHMPSFSLLLFLFSEIAATASPASPYPIRLGATSSPHPVTPSTFFYATTSHTAGCVGQLPGVIADRCDRALRSVKASLRISERGAYKYIHDQSCSISSPFGSCSRGVLSVLPDHYKSSGGPLSLGSWLPGSRSGFDFGSAPSARHYF